MGAVCALKKGRRSEILFFVVSAAIFYAFSLGRYCEPAYRVIFALPFGDLIRCPVKWHHLTELCLAVLAAYGIDGLRQTIGERGLARFGGLGTVVVCALVLFGAFDLVSEANRFCAPVSMKEARRTNSTMQLTILSRQQFQNPQVAAMARAGRIVSVANYMGNPDYFVVGILEPYKLDKHPADTTAILLGLVSLLSVFTVVMLAVRSRGSLESARQALVPPR